jgi:AcrR family transcriptional regulator
MNVAGYGCAMPQAPPVTATLGTVGARAVPTRLSERLWSDAPPHADALRAFKAARRTFIDRRPLEMGALAKQLGVERTSLFRWVGNRRELLTEVLWSFSIPLLDQVDLDTTTTGARRVGDVVGRYAATMIEDSFFRTYLQRERERALRILTTRAGVLQQRFIATIAHLLAQERATGAFDHVLGDEDLAYLLARICESFMYADLILGAPPDATKARLAFAVLLHEPEPLDAIADPPRPIRLDRAHRPDDAPAA